MCWNSRWKLKVNNKRQWGMWNINEACVVARKVQLRSKYGSSNMITNRLRCHTATLLSKSKYFLPNSRFGLKSRKKIWFRLLPIMSSIKICICFFSYLIETWITKFLQMYPPISATWRSVMKKASWRCRSELFLMRRTINSVSFSTGKRAAYSKNWTATKANHQYHNGFSI